MSYSCHNCGAEAAEPLFTAPAFDGEVGGIMPTYRVLRCQVCQLVNTDLSSLVSLADTYDEEYYGSGESKFAGLIEFGLRFVSARRARQLTRQWQSGSNTSQQPRVLDIGCGRALLLQALQAQGAGVMGLERPEFPIEEGLADIVRAGAINDASFADQRFDIVVLWHVLEHLEQQQALLDEIAAHLNPRGMLVLAVPNFGSLQQRLFGRYWFHLDLPRHLVHIDAAWLRKQLESRGFRIEREGHMDLLQNGYGFVQSAMNALFPARPNRLYSLLKHGAGSRASNLLPLVGWLSLGAILAPFAFVDMLLGVVLRRGATVKIMARSPSGPVSGIEKPDDQ